MYLYLIIFIHGNLSIDIDFHRLLGQISVYQRALYANFSGKRILDHFGISYLI